MNPGRRRRRTDGLWNFVTLLAVIATLVIAGGVAYFYLYPNNPFNLFPPLALPAEIKLPSATIQSTLQLQSQAQSTSTISASSTATDSPQSTLTPAWQTTPTPTAGIPVNIVYDFELRGSAQGVSANQYDPSRGCEWFGIAGRVTDLQAAPVRGIRVHLKGTLEQQQIDLISMSGTDQTYGEAGFEFFLGDQPIASIGQLTVQLVDQAGLPLSAIIPLDTYSDCEKNLIFLDFIEVR